MNNQKRNRALLIIAIVLLLANLSMLSLNWMKKPICKEDFKKEKHERQGKRNFNDRIASELNLSQEQLIKYKELKSIYFESIEPLREDIRKNKKLIYNELTKPNSDILYINQLTDSIGLLNTQIEKIKYGHFYEVKEELTPDQQENFKLLMKKLTKSKVNRNKKGSNNKQK